MKKFYYPNFDGVCSSEIWVFNTNEHSKYIYYLIQSKRFLDISNVSSGSKMPRSDWNFMKDFIFSIPDIKTQKETAKLFSVIDNKISILEKKHQSFIDFKKYLMQQIFTQKLRFDKECIWEEYQLYDIGETYNGLSGLSKDNFEKGDSQFITYKSIFDNNILSSNFTDNVELNDKSQNIVKKGDLFFTGSSETPEEVGMVSVLNCNIENCYLNSFCFGYRLKDNANINPIFLAYYLRSPVMRNKIMVLAQGSTRFNLSKKEILKLKINIPPITEQQKIKDLFQYLDKNINIISNQLHCINEFKRGLLQQMFV